MIRRVAAFLFCCTLAAGLVAAPLAWARSDRVVVYAPAKVFPTAVRFLRIDVGARIVEKDADAGYVMFELTEDKKTYPGSLELVGADSAGRPAAKIVLTIEGQPSYVEAVLLDKLEAKLRDELGEPPPAPPTRDRVSPGPSGPAPSPAPGAGPGPAPSPAPSPAPGAAPAPPATP
ncbi:MAG TPA: hypothetical protein VHE35_33460 [Kofleriaceae bacterium]|nr:hypothetical protein [Kofleriaceae bacterium]